MLKLSPGEIEAYLTGKGLEYRRRGRKAELKLCPFCGGGDHNDLWKCVVYLDETGGNFKCVRGNCDRSGSFWQLAEQFGDDPREFYEKRESFNGNGHKPERSYAAELRKPLTFAAEPVEPYKLTDDALAYLRKRGFSDDTLDAAPIWCDGDGNINFGYYHNGECCMVKVRAPRKPREKEQKAWQAWKGGLRTLWQLERCDFDKAPVLVVAFGEYDALALTQAGIPNAVSVPCGDQDLEWINVCYDTLKGLAEIILWIDNDESGRKSLDKIAARLGPHKIKVVESEYKDANECLLMESRKSGVVAAQDRIFELVRDARWIFSGDVVQFADIPDRETRFDGYKTGLRLLDTNLAGSLLGRLYLYSGSNKAGKSTLVNQLTAQVVEQGGTACVYTGEDDAQTYKYNLGVHVASYEGTAVVQSPSGATYSAISTAYRSAIDEWARDRLFVMSRRSGITEDSLLDNFQLAFERYGCDFFVVDNLMKLVAAKDSDNINFRQAQIVNKLSDFAKERNVHVALLVHTNKQDNEIAPPKTSQSIAGAKEIVNLCDAAINVWRVPEDQLDNFPGSAVVSILENRMFGQRTSAPCHYDVRVKTFAEEQADMTHVRYSLPI